MKKAPTFGSDFLSNIPHNSAEEDITFFTQTMWENLPVQQVFHSYSSIFGNAHNRCSSQFSSEIFHHNQWQWRWTTREIRSANRWHSLQVYFTDFNARLPAIGFIIKTHTDNTFRFVSWGASTSLTQVSQWITCALKALFPPSERLWVSELAECSISTGRVVDDAVKVKMNIHRMNVERFQEEGTFDFSFMYTTLDLQELNNQMAQYVRLCFEDSSSAVLKVHSRVPGRQSLLGGWQPHCSTSDWHSTGD